MQNFYNVARRDDDPLVDLTAREGIAYVPYFPLGGFSPLQSATLDAVAARLGATPMAVALAWLLQRSPNMLLIPGTSSVAHLRDNVAGAALPLDDRTVAELDDDRGRGLARRGGPSSAACDHHRVGGVDRLEDLVVGDGAADGEAVPARAADVAGGDGVAGIAQQPLVGVPPGAPAALDADARGPPPAGPTARRKAKIFGPTLATTPSPHGSSGQAPGLARQ